MINATAIAVLLDVDVQIAVEETDSEEPPSGELLNAWAQRAYAQIAAVATPKTPATSTTPTAPTTPAEVTIRLVSEGEMQALNRDYRDKNQVTNVLSFPFDLELDVKQDLQLNPLGDVVICHSVILQEARQQQKTSAAHYAHMVTHGILHLCGYDHQEKVAAEKMEALETQILAQSGIANPYI